MRLLSLLIFVSCISFGFSIHGQEKTQSQPDTPLTATSYTQDAQGLEKQFEPFLAAYAAGDQSAVDTQFAVFALPAPADWFGRNFQKAQVEQLGWDYEAEISLYEKSVLSFLKRSKKGTHFRVHCNPAENIAATGLQPRADAVLPINQVPIARFHINFTASDGHSSSHMANFVYVDGSYRYIGKGAYPFWAMPDATRKTNP